MASKTSIFNMALALLGQDTISDPDGSDKKAIKLRQVYDICRKALLEQHPWNFALKRASLDLETDAPAFEYDNAFGKPTDCLRIFKVFEPTSYFKEEGDLILSDDSGMDLLYVSNEEDTTQFSPLFTQLLATDMAIACEYGITGAQSLQQNLQSKRLELIKKAKMIDAQKDADAKPFASDPVSTATDWPYGEY